MGSFSAFCTICNLQLRKLNKDESIYCCENASSRVINHYYFIKFDNELQVIYEKTETTVSETVRYHTSYENIRNITEFIYFDYKQSNYKAKIIDLPNRTKYGNSWLEIFQNYEMLY